MSADSKPLASLATVAANSVSTRSQHQQYHQHHQNHQQISEFEATTSNLATTLNQNGYQPHHQDQHNLVIHQPFIINRLRPSNESVAGCAAAFINITLLFPVNKLIFRQMASGHKTSKAFNQITEEGLRYLYRGILPPLTQKMVSVSLMFGTFGFYQDLLNRKLTQAPYILNLSMAAILTGSTEAVLTPLERVQMLLQDRVHHKNYKHTLDALVKLWSNGLNEYYRGLTCVLVRNGLSNILFFGLRDEIKKLMPESNKWPQQQQQQQFQVGYGSGDSPVRKVRTKDSLLRNFLSGAILGMFISTLFYPLSVVRTRMQTRAPGTKFLSILEAYKAVYSERDRNFSRLFHGCFINVARQFVSWGIINCSYESILDLLDELD